MTDSRRSEASWFDDAMKSDEPLLPELQDALNDSLENLSGLPIIRHPFYTGILHHPALVNAEYVAARRVALEAYARGDYQTFMAFVSKPFRLSIMAGDLVFWKPKAHQLVSELPWVWSSSEPDDTEPAWLRLWRRAFAANGRSIVTDAKRVPSAKTWIVYRGEEGKPKKRGIAWTTKREVAEYFANRFGIDQIAKQPGTVYVGEVDRADILGYVTGRSEMEVIVPVSRVRILDKSSAPSPQVTAARARRNWATSLKKEIQS